MTTITPARRRGLGRVAAGLVLVAVAGCAAPPPPAPISLAAAPGPVATDAAGADLAAMFAGEKVYTRGFSGFWPRDDLLIFGPEGGLTDSYVVYRTGLGDIYIQDRGTRTGRWRAAGDRLCLRGAAMPRGAGEQCYRVREAKRLPDGPTVWLAEHSGGGESWTFVFARGVTLDWPWGLGANWGFPFFRLTDGRPS